ncbi:MAG: hypothetical protein ACLS43_11345 [Evtepia gabavorous]
MSHPPSGGFPVPHQQHGGLLAKGRLLGVQFCAILEDGLSLNWPAMPTGWPWSCAGL